MIYCFDTYYYDNQAKTSCIGISSWSGESIEYELSEITTGIHEYKSGSFYKRELPCLKSILKRIDLKEGEDTILIDGFVFLDDSGKPGLGGYLFDYLNSKIPVIGVAKNDFATINGLKRKVYRGESKKPLYITAKGISLDEASQKICSMHGKFRIPTVLKMVDKRCRNI